MIHHWFCFISFLSLGGMVIGLTFHVINKQRVYSQQVCALNLHHQNELRKATLDSKEQTLQDISRDIHDNISLGLTLSKLHLHTLNEERAPDIHEKLGLSIRLIGEAIHNLSDIARSLNADAIKDYGFISAIENEIEILSRTKLYDVDFQVHGAIRRYPPRTEVAIFRIIQESLKNIIRHAQATRIQILVAFTCSHCKVSIQDNGKGFSTDIKSKPGGAGLKNMAERALLISGDFKVISTIGKGTTIDILIPLKIQDEKRTTYHG